MLQKCIVLFEFLGCFLMVHCYQSIEIYVGEKGQIISTPETYLLYVFLTSFKIYSKKKKKKTLNGPQEYTSVIVKGMK